jgi:hypothetical protein
VRRLFLIACYQFRLKGLLVEALEYQQVTFELKLPFLDFFLLLGLSPEWLNGEEILHIGGDLVGEGANDGHWKATKLTEVFTDLARVVGLAHLDLIDFTIDFDVD